MLYYNKIEDSDANLLILLLIVLIVNPLSHFVQNVLGFGNTYYFSYACWLVLFIYFFGKSKVKVMRKTLYITIFLLFSFSVGTVWGKVYFDTGLSDFHVSIFVCIAYLIIMGIPEEYSIEKFQLRVLMRIIVLLGVLSSLYALIVQTSYFISVLRGIDLSNNSWEYVSFYRQRNIFAEYCFIATIAGCFMYLSTKKIRYALCILLFGLQIIVTCSRAGLIGYLLLVGLCIYQTRHNKILFAIVTIIIISIMIYTFDLDSVILEMFSHTTASGEDSGELRLEIWINCLNELFDKFAIFFGFGAGSTTAFITPDYDTGSSHNCYVDTLFTGGLVYLGIIIHTIIYSLKKVRIKTSDRAFYITWMSATVAYCIYCMMEAGIALYASNYFSVTLTILLVLIPRIYRDGQVKCKN
ncbi:MAG: O-antigen ligase family protein [Clostridiales bacterium]|nr:O-antigen ligase family protein [Clostridiales bacterium]